MSSSPTTSLKGLAAPLGNGKSTTAAHPEREHGPSRYPVFRAAFYTPFEDHHAIYVDVTEDRGHLFHVKGITTATLEFEAKKNSPNPLLQCTCLYIEPVGWVPEGHLDAIESVCMQVPPPEPQWDGEDKIEGARNSQNWVTETVEALLQARVIDALGAEDDGARRYHPLAVRF